METVGRDKSVEIFAPSALRAQTSDELMRSSLAEQPVTPRDQSATTAKHAQPSRRSTRAKRPYASYSKDLRLPFLLILSVGVFQKTPQKKSPSPGAAPASVFDSASYLIQFNNIDQ